MTEPLLVARLLFRSRDAFSQLPHVVENVSACLDTSVDMSIGRASEFESIRLLERIWRRRSDVYANMTDETPTSDEDWDLGRYLRTDKHYRQYQFNEALKWAAGKGNVAMAKWLFEHFPGCVVRAKAVKRAAKFGFVEVLQLFLDNDSGLLGTGTQEMVDRLGNQVEWTSDLMWKAAKRGQSHVVWWLNENLPNTPFSRSNAFVFAVSTCDIALAEWLLHHGARWPRQISRAWIAHEVAAKGRLDVLKWMAKKEQLDDIIGIVVMAAEKGHLHIVQWMLDRDAHLTDLGGEASLAIHTAADNGHLEVAKYLHARAKLPRNSLQRAIQSKEQDERLASAYRLNVWFRAGKITRQTMIRTAAKGWLDTVQWLFAEFDSDPDVDLFDSSDRKPHACIHAMDAAAFNGHLHVLEYLHSLQASIAANNRKRKRDDDAVEKSAPKCSENAVLDAAEHGHLDVVRWLWLNVPDVKSAKVLDAAARGGRLDVVKWLHEHGSEGCTTAAMDDAARLGHFEVLKWLHANRSEGCTTDAMNAAAGGGHFEIVRWLHYNTQAGCTTRAMNTAAMGGHLDIVKWLHANRSEGCTTAAMNLAACWGKLNVVVWLHYNRSEGCTFEALDEAADNDHFHVVRWLLQHRTEGCSQELLDEVAKGGNFEMLLLLHDRIDGEWIRSEEVAYSDESKKPDLHAWILTHYPSLRAAAEEAGA